MKIYKRCAPCGKQYLDLVAGIGEIKNTPVCGCGSQDFEHIIDIIPDWWEHNPEPAAFVLDGGAIPGLVLPEWTQK